MADIFLSYVRDDLSRAAELARVLTALGWEVWWDRKIRPGRSFRGAIAQELESAKCVIVLWSRRSVESEWVCDEADDAKGRDVLVSALIEHVKPPHGFRQRQTVNLVAWNGDAKDPEFVLLTEGIQSFVAPREGLLSAPPEPADPEPARARSTGRRIQNVVTPRVDASVPPAVRLPEPGPVAFADPPFRLPQSKRHVESRPPTPSVHIAPTILICSVPADLEAVERLAAHLRTAGIVVNHASHAATELTKMLEMVDYFLVVQSESTDTSADANFLGAIRIALKHQWAMPADRRFVLPLMRGDCQGLGLLAQFQSVNIDSPTGVAALVGAITKKRGR